MHNVTFHYLGQHGNAHYAQGRITDQSGFVKAKATFVKQGKVTGVLSSEGYVVSIGQLPPKLMAAANNLAKFDVYPGVNNPPPPRPQVEDAFEPPSRQSTGLSTYGLGEPAPVLVLKGSEDDTQSIRSSRGNIKEAEDFLKALEALPKSDSSSRTRAYAYPNYLENFHNG